MRRRIPKVALIVALAVGSLLPVGGASAATLAPIGSFDRPIFVTSDPANPNRLLVVEREGRVVLVEPAGVSLFGNLEPLVSCCAGERGLLSVAPAPDFAGSGRFYAAYTGTAAAGGAVGDIHVDAFRPGPAGGGQLLREPILAIPHADLANHNGGQLQLGPDGYLYVSTGDGGGSGDPFGSGQRLDTLLGKVLRIDPRPGSSPAYEVPSGNPFVGVAGRDEIWSYGLRNPWRFSFDRGSGDLVIADVGQGVREEVDHAPSPAPGSVGGAGANYGWNCREGFVQYSGAPPSCVGATGFADPAFDYPHTDPGGGKAHGCSITGGYVVRDASLGSLFGRYLYADFCVGQLRSLVLPGPGASRASGDRSEGLTVPSPVSFGEDSCGRIYVASNEGTVYRLQGDVPTSCPPSRPPPPPPPVSPSVPPSAPPPPSSVEASGASPAAPETPARPADDGVIPQVHLHARPARRGSFALIVRVSPCGDNRRSVVQLNRGGRPLRRKRLDARCAARFEVRVSRTSTFRAVLGDQRSQVRTIALAKPSP